MAHLPPAPGKLFDVGGYRLHASLAGMEHTGTAPAVLFHGGLMGPALTWTRVLPLVGEFAPALAIDRPGYAWSDPAPAGQPRSGRIMVEESRALLRSAGLEPPVILVGHSLGAIVCLLHTYTYPGEVAGIVFVEPSHPRQMSVRGMPSTRLYRINMGVLGWLIKTGLGRGMGNLLARQMLGSIRDRLSDEEWQTAVAIFRQPAFYDAALAEIDTLEVTLLSADRPSGSLGDLPIVILEADDWFSPRSRPMRSGVRALRQEMLTLSSNATYERVDNCNHVTLPLLAPERVAAAIQSVLQAR